MLMRELNQLLKNSNRTLFNNSQYVNLIGLSEVFADYFNNLDYTKSRENQILKRIYPNRESYFDFEGNTDSEILADIDEWSHMWLYSNAYRLKTLYDTTIQEYNPIENYDRYEETETEHSTETNAGARTHTKGVQTNTAETTNEIGSRSEQTSYGADTTETVNGAVNKSLSYGSDTTQTVYGNTSKSYVNGERTSTDTIGEQTRDTETEEQVTAFTTENYKDNNKTTENVNEYEHENTHVENQYTNTESETAHTDTATRSAHTDTETTQAHTDTATRSAHTDTHTAQATEDSTASTYTDGQRQDTDSAYQDSTEGTTNTISHIHGNIGVTTAAQMLESQRQLAQFEFWKTVYRLYVNDLCRGVI